MIPLVRYCTQQNHPLLVSRDGGIICRQTLKVGLEASDIFRRVGHTYPDSNSGLVVLVDGRYASTRPGRGDGGPHQCRSCIGSCENSCPHMVGDPKGYGAKGCLILVVPESHILGSDWGGVPGQQWVAGSFCSQSSRGFDSGAKTSFGRPKHCSWTHQRWGLRS